MTYSIVGLLWLVLSEVYDTNNKRELAQVANLIAIAFFLIAIFSPLFS